MPKKTEFKIDEVAEITVAHYHSDGWQAVVSCNPSVVQIQLHSYTRVLKEP
jgi:hypothetical protein